MATYRIGSKGDEVKRIQQKLTELGYDPGPADGDFGGMTRYAVRRFQRDKGLDVDGTVGPDTWRALFMQESESLPALAREPLNVRCLVLTGVIETGHAVPWCYSSLSGDFDGMGLSFGVCQWCLGAGSLQPLLQEMLTKHPGIFDDIFDEYSPELRAMLSDDREGQLEWARSIQTSKFRLIQPWKGMFEALGQTPEFQRIEQTSARGKFDAALELCREYGLRSERAVALMYDIKVQNGSIKPVVKQAILQAFRNITGTGEAAEVQRLRIIGERRAAACLPRWVEQVRARKLAIANGEGMIHGSSFHLAEQYGITMSQVPELLTGPPFREVHGSTTDPKGGVRSVPA